MAGSAQRAATAFAISPGVAGSNSSPSFSLSMLGTPPTAAAAQGTPVSMASPRELGLFSMLEHSR